MRWREFVFIIQLEFSHTAKFEFATVRSAPSENENDRCTSPRARHSFNFFPVCRFQTCLESCCTAKLMWWIQIVELKMPKRIIPVTIQCGAFINFASVFKRSSTCPLLLFNCFHFHSSMPFPDLAVGAPYEEIDGLRQGAVYIFLGSKDGLLLHYAQKVYPSNLKLTDIASFGASISRGGDLDQNSYNGKVTRNKLCWNLNLYTPNSLSFLLTFNRTVRRRKCTFLEYHSLQYKSCCILSINSWALTIDPLRITP